MYHKPMQRTLMFTVAMLFIASAFALAGDMSTQQGRSDADPAVTQQRGAQQQYSQSQQSGQPDRQGQQQSGQQQSEQKQQSGQQSGEPQYSQGQQGGQPSHQGQQSGQPSGQQFSQQQGAQSGSQSMMIETPLGNFSSLQGSVTISCQDGQAMGQRSQMGSSPGQQQPTQRPMGASRQEEAGAMQIKVMGKRVEISCGQHMASTMQQQGFQPASQQHWTQPSQSGQQTDGQQQPSGQSDSGQQSQQSGGMQQYRPAQQSR